MGGGFAIPHARVHAIEQPLTLFMRLKRAIAFGAPDGCPVSQLLVILVPTEGSRDDHLALLAAVARLFSDADFRSSGALVRAKSVLGGLRHEYSLWSTPALPRELHGPLNRMTENAEALKSGATPAGRHFCGGAPGDRQGVKGASP